jgi:hypothetical protein
MAYLRNEGTPLVQITRRRFNEPRHILENNLPKCAISNLDRGSRP